MNGAHLAWTLLVASASLNIWLLLPNDRSRCDAMIVWPLESSTSVAVPENEPLSLGRALSAASNHRGQATSSTSTMQDCASVACPALFGEGTPVERGLSTLVPWPPDTRIRVHPPHSMLELTQLLYGASATVGEPYRGFSNPFGKRPDLNYEWTQLKESILEQAWALLPHRGKHARLVVEVGSFVGRSSVLIGNWLRKRQSTFEGAGRAHNSHTVPLLCVDTWTGDVGMTLNQVYPEKIAKKHGHPTLYHTWLLNIIASNLTEQVLPLVAPSLLGARVLDFLRLSIDVLYLDSAHEFRETFMELGAYWPLIRPGGLLIGDDLNWRAVSHDAQLFARTHNLTLSSFDGCHEKLISSAKAMLCVWYLRKPEDARLKGAPLNRRPQLREWRDGRWVSGQTDG
jgi:hypothetical protein